MNPATFQGGGKRAMRKRVGAYPAPEWDEALWSPGRIVRAVAIWMWFETLEPPVHVPLRNLLLCYRRPYAGRDRY